MDADPFVGDLARDMDRHEPVHTRADEIHRRRAPMRERLGVGRAKAAKGRENDQADRKEPEE
ncbi:hypothetical protein [Methylobacterium sp. Leaf108]|uniref:hypothetical protein n=1 Tax=Methylobacterium sp. Leaf108 TaxID=1736256 RepID=UPI0012E8CEC4|nr:hypothetical protein [Methylobacterium sp. Leaf108]